MKGTGDGRGVQAGGVTWGESFDEREPLRGGRVPPMRLYLWSFFSGGWGAAGVHNLRKAHAYQGHRPPRRLRGEASPPTTRGPLCDEDDDECEKEGVGRRSVSRT